MDYDPSTGQIIMLVILQQYYKMIGQTIKKIQKYSFVILMLLFFFPPIGEGNLCISVKAAIGC
jgi:hypothetical protein